MNLTFPNNFICPIFFSLLPFSWHLNGSILQSSNAKQKNIFSYDRTMRVLRVLNCRIKFQIRLLISTGLITEEMRCDSSNGVGLSLKLNMAYQLHNFSIT